jgi:methyltransferase (TIGR00027 family)
MRKRFFEDGARSAVQRGVRQVLSIGAGYDTLCWRLAEEFPEVCWIETDSPATSEVKRRGVEALGLPANLHLLGVDLARRDLGEFLAEQAAAGHWDPDAPSLVLAEAVLMYVPPAGVERFFEVVGDQTGTGSRVLFTFLPKDEAGVVGGANIDGFTRWTLRQIGEPFEWGVPADEIEGFLLERGWRVTDHPDLAERRARWLAPLGLGQEPAGDIEEFVEAENIGSSTEPVEKPSS